MPMMLFLIFNILPYGRQERLTIRERTETALPVEITMKETVVYPSCRLPFEGFNQLANRFRGMHTYQQMYMISSPANSDKQVFPILACTSKVLVQLAFPFRVNQCFTTSHSKDNVHVYLSICISHC